MRRTRSQHSKLVALSIAVTAACMAITSVAAALVVPGLSPQDITSVFRFTKNENRNEVHYGLRVDAACAPRTKAPLLAYWLNREIGPRAVEGLARHEARAYGIGRQTVVRGANGHVELRVVLNSMPERPLRILSSKQGNRCTAGAFMRIGNEALAQLDSIHVVLAGLGMIDHVDYIGHLPNGRVVRERVQ